MKVNVVRRLGVICFMSAVLFFAGCAGAPAPVVQKPPTEEVKEAITTAPEPEVAVVAPKEEKQKPAKVFVPQPPTTAQYWSQALMSYEDAEYSSALDNIVKVRESKPDYPGARQLETRLRYQLQDASGGLPLLEEMVKRGEGGAAVVHTFTRWSAKSGQAANAQNVLEELIDMGEDADPELLAALGWLYHSIGNEAEAVDLFNLIGDKPQAATFAPFLARARFETGDYAGVRELFERERPGGELPPLQVRLAMADVNRMEGRASAAEAGYLQVLEGAPENYWAQVNLAILKLGQGDAKGARILLEKSAAERPQQPEAWCNLGLALRELGEHDEALVAYEKALAVDPDHPQTLKNIGILWEKYFGEPAKGLNYYDKYLKVVGNDEEVTRWHKAAARLAGSAQ